MLRRRESNPRHSSRVEFHQTGTFMTLYRMSYSTVADEHVLKLTSVDLKSRRLTENKVIERHSAAEVLWT